MSVALAAIAAFAAPLPSIIHIIADDLGYNDLGYMNGNRTYTPQINALALGGIRLTTYYTFRVCAPARASILTGRYPWGVGYYDMKGPLSVPTDFKMLPALLKEAGYETHAIGKWDLGNKLKPYTPTWRGFDTFFGYYHSCQADVWYHGIPKGGCGTHGSGDIFDYSNSTKDTVLPAEGLNGTYNEQSFTSEAERIIAGHGQRRQAGSGVGLYIYLAYHNCHDACPLSKASTPPLQATKASVGHYSYTVNDTFKVQGGMITDLDNGVGRVAAALRNADLMRDAVIAFCSDNGGPLTHSTNAPLRGGKHTAWEGGLRGVAWVHSWMLTGPTRFTEWTGLMHASDWLPTFVQGIAGMSLGNGSAEQGPRPLDGYDMWPSWSGAAPPPRTEVAHQVVNQYCNNSVTDPTARLAPYGASIRIGKWKLIGEQVGKFGDDVVAWPAPSADPVPLGVDGALIEPGTDHVRAQEFKPGKGTTVCSPWCLFDLETDPSESNDVAADPANVETVKLLASRIEELGAGGPPWAWPLQRSVVKVVEAENCAAANRSGFYEPLRAEPPQ